MLSPTGTYLGRCSGHISFLTQYHCGMQESVIGMSSRAVVEKTQAATATGGAVQQGPSANGRKTKDVCVIMLAFVK